MLDVRRRDDIVIPPALVPLLARPPGWPVATAWRITAAACRASGFVAWSARIESPERAARDLEGLTPSRPRVLQSEGVEALIRALEQVPADSAVEVIAPTSLRYLVEGRELPRGTPERRLADLAAGFRIWARYALGELEDLTNARLAQARAVLAPLRWPKVEPSGPVLFADGGCNGAACAAAWVLRQGSRTVAENCWTLPPPLDRDAVRVAEFVAVRDGVCALPEGSAAAVVTDHVDVTDFGVRGETPFRPSPRMAAELEALRACASRRTLRWYWAEHNETDGQRRCQALVERRLRASGARERFLQECAERGLRRVYLPRFEHWLAPRGPAPATRRAWPDIREEWGATFEQVEAYLQADPATPRVYLRQFALPVAATLETAFAGSAVARWCETLEPRLPLAGARAAYVGRLRSAFEVLVLLFDPAFALLVQPRPGATMGHVFDVVATLEAVRVPGALHKSGLDCVVG